MANNVFKKAGVGPIVAKQGDISVQSQSDPRAILQAKHVREILATGCMDPQPAGDCGVCIYCILYNSETVVPAVVPCVMVDQFSKWIIEYEAESEATAHVNAHGQFLATSSVILANVYF